MQTNRTTTYAIAVAILSGIGVVACLANGPQTQPTKSKKPSKQPATMKPYMQAKLTQSQRILEGLVTHDFEQVRKAAHSLTMNSLSSPRAEMDDVVDDKVYEHFATEFMRLSSKLESSAEKRNLDGATLTYHQLTATCIACHEHLRDRELTDADIRPPAHVDHKAP